MTPRAGSLFSGIGLLDYGLHLAGWEHAFLCEAEPDRRDILRLRWPGVPVYDDVRDVDGSALGIDLLALGFPCRGASSAGKREGLDHPETALWREAARVIGALRPPLVLVENVANLLAVRRGGAWGEVLGDLASLGYVVAWDCLPAAAFGAPHLRDRVFAVAAYTDGPQEQRGGGHRREQNGRPDAGGGDYGAVAHASRYAEGGPGSPSRTNGERTRSGSYATWAQYAPAIERWEAVAGPVPQPLLRGVDDRGARRVVRSRLSALGDGVQVQAGHFLGERLKGLLNR